jgi:hypothetical protein
MPVVGRGLNNSKRAQLVRLRPNCRHLSGRRFSPLRAMTDETQSEHNESGLPLKADVRATSVDFAFGPKHKVAALQPAARGQEPRGW